MQKHNIESTLKLKSTTNCYLLFNRRKTKIIIPCSLSLAMKRFGCFSIHRMWRICCEKNEMVLKLMNALQLFWIGFMETNEKYDCRTYQFIYSSAFFCWQNNFPMRIYHCHSSNRRYSHFQFKEEYVWCFSFFHVFHLKDTLDSKYHHTKY